MAFCNMCGAQIADGATVCAACSGRTATAPVIASTGSGLADNVAGMLAYVTIIPAIVFLVVEPYNKSRFRPLSRMAVHILQYSLVDFVDRVAHGGSFPFSRFPHRVGVAAGRPRRFHNLDHPAAEGKSGPNV